MLTNSYHHRLLLDIVGEAAKFQRKIRAYLVLAPKMRGELLEPLLQLGIQCFSSVELLLYTARLGVQIEGHFPHNP